jgi:ketosteroid isomerase-like protein
VNRRRGVHHRAEWNRVEGFARALAEAWRRCAPDAAAALFTVDALYRPLPFDEPLSGRQAIRSHLVESMRALHDVHVWFSEPVPAGAWASAEWWISYAYDDEPATTAGASVFRLARDGRCRELHEYPLTENGRMAPYDGWGSGR